MSSILRGPWLIDLTRKKLADGIAQRDGGAVEPGKVLDTIGPLGELQFPGDKFKLLQVIEFLSHDNPVTAVLSDKSVTITCKFSSASKSAYEASSGPISGMKGGIIKPISYQIHFLGVDGKLFWKGVTHEDQIAGEPRSRKTGNRAKQALRSNGGSSGSAATDSARNTRADFPTPEPVLYINDFTFIGSAGSAVWGPPASISLRTDVEELLKKLPRKKYTKEETPVGFGQGCQPMDTVVKSPLQGKSKARGKGQRSGNTAGGTSRKNTLPKLHKRPKNAYDSDDEIHSQPELNGDGEEQSQLAFTTQAPARFSSTYDDLEFSTQADQGKEARAKAIFPQLSSIPNSSQSTGHSPQVVIITKPRRRGDIIQIKAGVEKEKKYSGKPKLINYSDGTGFDGSTTGSVASDSGSKKICVAANNQHKRVSGQRSSSFSESGQADVEAGGALEKGSGWGWQGMITITKEDTVIPKNQQELLDQPESWYPHQVNQLNQYSSGYSLVPKVQPIPKSHLPRDRSMPLPTKLDILVTSTPRQPSPTPSPEDEELFWPPSPVRPPKKDINAMPPDSSMPSGAQLQHAGRWSAGNQENKNTCDIQETNMEDSSSISQQALTPLEAGFGKNRMSPAESPLGNRDHSEREETPEDVIMDKRVTRAANGISKKAPVDPNNVEPSRMAKANQKLKTSVARKRFRLESESEETSEESESPEDELINDPDLPFEVVNPYGRTRVDVFGGILKAQQVQMWEKRKKDKSLGDENEIPSGYDGHASNETPIGKEGGRRGRTGVDNVLGAILKAQQVQLREKQKKDKSLGNENEIQSGYDGHASDEPISKESVTRVNVLMEAARSIVEPVVSKPSNIQNTGDHSHNSRLPGSGNNLTKLTTETPEATSSSHNSKVIKPLFPSKPNTAVLRPTPSSSVELPVERQDLGTDDEDEIPQAPLMPLIIMADTKAKISGILGKNSPFIDRPKETLAKLGTTPSTKSQAGANNSSQSIVQPKAAPGDSPSTAVLLQMSSASAVPDVLCKQSSFKTPPFLPSSDSNTAPTVQVEETPYRKGGSGIRNSQPPSPTVSRTHAIPGYFHSEFDDITLIPGTNTEELGDSGASAHARLPTPDQGSSPPEIQVISLDYIPSSMETGNHDVSFPDDFAMPQRQLRREIQQRTEVEVPATAEMDDTRVQYTGSQQPPSQKFSKGKHRRLIKSVDFQSQEIRTANTHNVSSMLENQKRQFLSLEDGHNFESLDPQVDFPLPMNECWGKPPEIKIPKSLANISGVHSSLTPARHVGTYLSISSDEDVIPNISPSNTRKRHQPTSSDVPKPAKKPRAGGKSIYGTSHTLPLASASIHAAHDTVETPTGPRNELSRTTSIESVDEDRGEIEPEADNDDLMAGFPPIESSIDNAPEPPWPSQTPSKPEIYAGIRERHLYVPGYGNLTDDQKKELDKRRREYFGITPREGAKRLFSVKLQRAMQSASSSPSLRKRVKHTGGGKAVKTMGSEWYRDENTPLKIFYRNFKELKQVKAELESGIDGSGV